MTLKSGDKGGDKATPQTEGRTESQRVEGGAPIFPQVLLPFCHLLLFQNAIKLQQHRQTQK